MKKSYAYSDIEKIVNESVNAVLQEWMSYSMPGKSSNPKVAAAQSKAYVGRVGRDKTDPYPHRNDSSFESQEKRDGGRKGAFNSLSTILSVIRHSDDETYVKECGEQLAMIMNRNKEIGEKVANALSNDSLKHYREYTQWNPED